MDLILKYFPHLSTNQIDQFQALQEIYRLANQKVNLISRQDIQFLYLKHILHSLALAKFLEDHSQIQTQPCTITDIGTGGGFPGVPLSIFFPNSSFILVDSISKKMKILETIIQSLNLQNTQLVHDRSENLTHSTDFVTARAVSTIDNLLKYTQNLKITQGYLLLKGGNLEPELSSHSSFSSLPIQDYFTEEFFQEKYIVHHLQKPLT